MKKLEFSTKNISKGYLILINPSHPVKQFIQMDELVPLYPYAEHVLLERQAAKVLMQIMSSLGCKNEIVPVSGYRTMQEQQKIYADSIKENGEIFTQKFVAIPGCSEHHTGLAIDLALNSGNMDFICPEFPYTGICGRFREVAVKYGFIERYPADREQITKIAHEPWHFRYVGYPHSEIMKKKNLTLEEYTEYLKRFAYKRNHLQYSNHRYDYEIFYVPVETKSNVFIELPDDISCQLSGNNEDGVVVTLWRERL